MNNPYNKRVDNQESKVVRGDILADDGDVLATTLTDEDGNETRYYPYDNLFCHSVGFTSLTGMKTGIEQSQNYFLLSETDNVVMTCLEEKQRGIMLQQHLMLNLLKRHIKHLVIIKVQL